MDVAGRHRTSPDVAGRRWTLLDVGCQSVDDTIRDVIVHGDVIRKQSGAFLPAYEPSLAAGGFVVPLQLAGR